MCDDQINQKNSLNSLKHTIHNLLAIIHFLHLMIIRNREFKRKVFLPFTQFYFRTSGCIKQKYGNPLRKFRKCVWAVVAMERMKKKQSETIQGSGLMRYSSRALATKSRIQDLGSYLDSLLMKSLSSEENCLELLNNNKLVYRWMGVPNYMRVQLPYGRV